MDELIQYANPSVIARYCYENPECTSTEAEQLFQDLLAWLWLSHQRAQRQLQTHMITPLLQLDRMWHVFILHTHAYSDFCTHYFGQYLHHDVIHHDAEPALSNEQLAEYLDDCYEQLGEAWLLRNFPL